MRNRKGRYYQIPNEPDSQLKSLPSNSEFDSITLMPIKDTSSPDISKGFVSVGRPQKPSFQPRAARDARNAYTDPSDHWKPLGPHRAPASAYLGGKRRPGGSQGMGHHSK